MGVTPCPYLPDNLHHSITPQGNQACVHHLFSHRVMQIFPFPGNPDFPSAAFSPRMQARVSLLTFVDSFKILGPGFSHLIILLVAYHYILEIGSPIQGWINYEADEI